MASKDPRWVKKLFLRNLTSLGGFKVAKAEHRSRLHTTLDHQPSTV
jgi:hypothetical protein